jgi:hypothetical protein
MVGHRFDDISGGTVRRICVARVGVAVYQPWVVGVCPVWVVCLHLFSRSGLEPLLGCCFHESFYRKVLEFRLNDGSGELVDSAIMDCPAHTSYGYGRKMHAIKSPFLSITTTWQHLVFDTRTRVFYNFPEFRVALVRGGSYE